MSSGKVYSAVYSGVQVYEMMIHGIATMVRGEDSYLNATQILKVAGFEKTRRSKILEREVLIGEHEKVQGGYGKYQGTWIPFEKGKELAERYEVLDSLMPLLNFDPSTLKNEEKHDDVSSPSKTPLLLPAPPSPKAQKRPKHTQSQARKKLKLVGVSPEPIGPEDAFYEHHRNLLMSIFLSDNPDDVPSLLSSVLLTKDLNIDLVIDEQGHTALHWAAALGRVRVVELLIQNGANVCRLNYEGETPLMRAAMITCCYEKKCFMEMVEMLADSVHVTDDRGRTVLHHIALTASVEGYTDAAIYYMKRFVKAVPKKSILKNILNIKDTQYYESALAIALRLECQDIVDVLIKQGATDPLITKMEEEQDMEFDPVDYKTKSKGPDMIKTMQHMIEKLEDDYQEQLRKKDMVAFELRRELGMVKYELREAQRRLDFPVSMQLAEARKRIAQLEAQVSQEEPMIIDESNEEEDKSTKERKLEKKIKSLQSQADMNIKTIERLQHELEAEKKRAHDKEMEYRRLIAASCGLPIERIDALIKPLTLAVESDPPDLDMARVIALMEKPTA
ncbi:hypothetical protein CU098_011047 [Rhizopus stolonifer]|uniref:HTH APSES-type domain-containing protein n=1 Tax=Rhizopus stolonifer TaxID=4846 RepID=A0A367KKL9_RHIST|nr:hypothetical protein CU098_011047 [Rhizopus stolonifer]